MNTLHLSLKAKWYDMIESGEKPEEYREKKPYWITRLIERRYMVDGHHQVEERITTEEAQEICKEGLDIRGNCLFLRDYKKVCFSYGYTKRRMTWEIESICIGYGNPEWGAPKDEEVFIIKLGRRIK